MNDYAPPRARELSDLEMICLRAIEDGKEFPEHVNIWGDREDGIIAATFPDHVGVLQAEDWLENQLWGHEARRRRQLKANGGRATPAQVRARVEFYGGLCWVCREVPYEAIDHVKPINRGGGGWPANLRPVCNSCNSRKKDHWPYRRPE